MNSLFFQEYLKDCFIQNPVCEIFFPKIVFLYLNILFIHIVLWIYLTVIKVGIHRLLLQSWRIPLVYFDVFLNALDLNEVLRLFQNRYLYFLFIRLFLQFIIPVIILYFMFLVVRCLAVNSNIEQLRMKFIRLNFHQTKMIFSWMKLARQRRKERWQLMIMFS